MSEKSDKSVVIPVWLFGIILTAGIALAIRQAEKIVEKVGTLDKTLAVTNSLHEKESVATKEQLTEIKRVAVEAHDFAVRVDRSIADMKAQGGWNNYAAPASPAPDWSPEPAPAPPE